jgi:hypothetical protein
MVSDRRAGLPSLGYSDFLVGRGQEIAGAVREEERAIAASAHGAVLSARERSDEAEAA